MNEKKNDSKARIKDLTNENRRLRIKQTAWVEELCHLRCRIDQTELHIKHNDKEIRELKKQLYKC